MAIRCTSIGYYGCKARSDEWSDKSIAPYEEKLDGVKVRKYKKEVDHSERTIRINSV